MTDEAADIFKDYIRYKYVIENIKDVIWEMDMNLIFTFVSPAAKDLSGYEAAELTGRSMLDFLTAASRDSVVVQWQKNVPKRIDENLQGIMLYDVQFICKNQHTIWCEVCVNPVFQDKQFVGYIGTTRDVSEKKKYEEELKTYLEELKIKNEQLEKLATLDMLTGAYNRRKLDYFLSRAIDHQATSGTPFSIIMFDIDNFKGVNDQNGHKKGDQVLQDVTALIQQIIRKADKLFRWGGDEFTILLPELTLASALKAAEMVREAIYAYDFKIGPQKVSLSLGVGEYSRQETPDQFVTRVDNALLRAKSSGRNQVEASSFPI